MVSKNGMAGGFFNHNAQQLAGFIDGKYCGQPAENSELHQVQTPSWDSASWNLQLPSTRSAFLYGIAAPAT